MAAKKGIGLTATEALVLSRKYTDDTSEEFGAVKGAPCEIQSITQTEGGAIVTFRWENSEGEERTDEAFLKNGPQGEPGQNGKGIKRSYINSEGHMIVVYDDNTEDDLGEITIVEGGGSLEEDINVSVNVGGYKSGNVIPGGTSFDKVFRDMLNPTAYPSFTAPSATLSATGAKLLEAGSTLDTVFTIAFNRGTINPAYGTSGYRSGVATSYTFDGETKTTNIFARTVTEAKTSYQASVAFEAGEQPKDSTGADYSTPYPAGSVNSSKVEYEFVDAWWSNTAVATTIAKNNLLSKKTKQTVLNFPATPTEHPETFDVPASWTVTGVEVKNDLTGNWDDCLSTFAISNVTHNNAASEEVDYKRYTCNLGYDMGARQIRVKWS